MPAFPSIDLTDADLSPLVRGADRARRTVTQAIESPGGTARGAATATTQTAIGLGVLAWQRLQVRRQEIARALRD
ncbi:MAG: hypothetical protein AAF945_05500 [Actinomycetota bacterium]